jgi:hypothetical protein
MHALRLPQWNSTLLFDSVFPLMRAGIHARREDSHPMSFLLLPLPNLLFGE